MKSGIHPANYRDVLFVDSSSDLAFVTRSTLSTNETRAHTDGKTYPLYKLDVSSESHPFYTGKTKILDTGGRVDKFRKRYALTGAKASEPSAV